MPFVKRKKRPEISSPTNFEHRVHSGYDHNNGVFVGLPTQWNSIISETEQQKLLLAATNANTINNNSNNNENSLNNVHLFNNQRSQNGYTSRPKPIVDPSRISPTELTCFKVCFIIICLVLYFKNFGE